MQSVGKRRDTRGVPDRSGPRSSWAERYGVALFSIVAALVMVIVGVSVDDSGFAFAGLVVMGGYAVVAAWGGAHGRFQLLRGEYDERERQFDYHAHRISSTLIGLILMVLWFRDITYGNYTGWPQYLLALWGATFGCVIAFYYLRDRWAR